MTEYPPVHGIFTAKDQDFSRVMTSWPDPGGFQNVAGRVGSGHFVSISLGSGQKVLESRGSGRVGSGQEVKKTRGSGTFRGSGRVGSGRVGSGRGGTGRVRRFGSLADRVGS